MTGRFKGRPGAPAYPQVWAYDPPKVEREFSLSHSGIRSLRRAAAIHGAGEAEQEAIRRLEKGTALRVHLERLAPLASAADLPWDDFFPELRRTA